MIFLVNTSVIFKRHYYGCNKNIFLHFVSLVTDPANLFDDEKAFMLKEESTNNGNSVGKQEKNRYQIGGKEAFFGKDLLKSFI